MADISEPDSQDTRGDRQRRRPAYRIAQTISYGKRHGIFIQFTAMCPQPDATHPVQNDGRNQQQRLRIAIEETDILTVDIKAENNEGSEGTANTLVKDQFTIVRNIAPAGVSAVDEMFGMHQFRIALGHGQAQEEKQ